MGSAIRSIFPLGQTVITRHALGTLSTEDVATALSRHASGDWGVVDAQDAKANADALRYGGRLFSSYQSSKGGKFWVITEADRSATTILLPEDY